MMSTGKSVAFLASVFLVLAALHMIPSSENKRPLELNSEITEEVLNQWRLFKLKFHKSYATPEEESYRIKVFYENLSFIEDNQGDTYSLAINHFADLTNAEFKAIYLGLYQRETSADILVPLGSLTPGSVNWVEQKGTPPVQNQGSCGSCWAFSATEAIESAYAVLGNQSVLLSEEQLVQCSTSNNGCNGGLMTYAFEYVLDNPLNTAANYPYTSGSGSTGACNKALAQKGTYGIGSYKQVPRNDCEALETALNSQPIAVAVDASNWQFYHGGIFTACGNSLNHGVLAVGYNITEDGSSSYWFVQNSWGVNWGENGFIRLGAQGAANTCGICIDASYPLLE